MPAVRRPSQGRRRRQQVLPVPRRRPESRMGRIENFVMDYVKSNSGGPKFIAAVASSHLGEPVTRQQVYRVLRENDFTRKTSSVVPRQSVRLERREHLITLRMIWLRPDMVRLARSLLQ